jgi:adenylate cyclase
MRLRTIAAKLLALVGLPLVLMLAMVPALFYLIHDQLVEESNDRLVNAERAFQLELDDDLRSLELATRVIASDPETRLALAAGDVVRTRHVIAAFSSVYPGIDLIIADATGRVLAEGGPSNAPRSLRDIPELANRALLAPFHGVLRGGCTHELGGAPARVWLEPIGDVGVVIACERLDAAYIANASGKLALDLALLDSGDSDRPIEWTAKFPRGVLGRAAQAPAMFEIDGRTWAAARFEPRVLPGSHGRLSAVAAIDVSALRAVVVRHLMIALAALGLAALVSIGLGASMARTMSRALTSVTHGLRKVVTQNYVPIPTLDTGDELEELALGFNSMVDGLKERDNLRSTFGKYMTESVMEHLLKGNVSLGGETITVTMLFTDIRGFTSISERMDAQALVGLLNEYFTEMVGVVMQHGGVVDKYIGDAIMAVFGAPVPRPDDAVNAVRAAVGMRVALDHLNARLAERGIPAIRTGIGLHTGQVVAGNIGSESRMEYTVIGDAVNLASRLESNTKELGVDVLISSDTYELTKHAIQARPVSEITVKGRVAPVMTYEVLGVVG